MRRIRNQIGIALLLSTVALTSIGLSAAPATAALTSNQPFTYNPSTLGCSPDGTVGFGTAASGGGFTCPFPEVTSLLQTQFSQTIYRYNHAFIWNGAIKSWEKAPDIDGAFCDAAALIAFAFNGTPCGAPVPAISTYFQSTACPAQCWLLADGDVWWYPSDPTAHFQGGHLMLTVTEILMKVSPTDWHHFYLWNMYNDSGVVIAQSRG